MHLPAPFGKYELLERIATGGMAEVFLARSFGVAGFEKRLVIKRIRPELAQDPRLVGMFINEAKISVHLNHPNVVQVYDLGRTGTSHYIAMEHLHGRDLNRLVKTLRAAGERLPLPIAVRVVAEACRGLAYAHGRRDATGALLGLVHRDVSPHNLLVTFAGEVKLVDFGIARLMNTAQGKVDGMAPGRPGGGKYAYMSPEQARGDDVDHRTDLFSAGIVLWELIVGHRLFQDPDPAEKLRRVQEAIIPHPRDEGVEIDEELWAILLRALARRRDDRYASAALLEEDLRAWLFRSGARVGAPEIAALMRQAFPDEADRPAHEVDLRRIVADVEQLDAPTQGTHTQGLTPTDQALPGRLRPSEGERKSVVALVVDVDGLTDLSAAVEPEVLFKHHYQLLRWIRRIVDRYHGCVHRSVDDQLLLLFGIPRTRADDLPRALECALELQRRSGELRARALSVELAIGVHVGEVTVGPGRRQVRYVARGDTTRLARRLSASADHGQVLVSERVLQAAAADFRLRRGPDLAGRGSRATEATYVLEGRRRGFRVAGRGPWLRRGTELEVVRDGLVALGAGEGRAITLTGESGTGKSRLVREIRDLAQRRGLPVFLGRCAPFGGEGADPFPDLLRDVLGAEPDTPREVLQERLPRLAELKLSPADLQVLGSLLGLAERPPDPHAVWQALSRLVVGLSRGGAVLVALEDLDHLAERALTRLRTLVQAVTRHPVMLLLTHRGPLPEPLQGLGPEVVLGPFPPSAQRRLVRGLLEADAIDPRIEDLLERTCEGNPLYLEEMVKVLLQEGRIQVRDGRAESVGDLGEAGLPGSLAGLVGARIDALDAASKGALQLAAVIGSTFSANLLGEAAGLDDPTPLIVDLASHGLVVRAHAGGADTWSFSSELVREAALRGILGVQRRDYHRLVAAAIESVHSEHLDAWVEALAHHCAHGGRPLDAARYAWRAGQAYESTWQLERARDCHAQGLRWLQQAPQTPETWDARIQGEGLLQLHLGTVTLLLGDTARGEAALQLALDVAADAGLPDVEVRAHVELGRSYLQRGRTNLAAAHLMQARELLHLAPDDDLGLEVLECEAVLAYEEGRSAEAERLWQDALGRAGGNPAAVARCLLGLGNRHLRAGQAEDASPFLERALEAARTAGDRILEGRVLNNVGLLHSWAGRHDQALACFRQALEVREGIGYLRGVVVNHHNIGDVHFARGDHARAHVAFTRSRELAAEIGWERGVVLNEVYLGYLDARVGDPTGLQRVDEGVQAARALGDFETAVTGAWLAGRHLLESNHTAEARSRLTEGLDEARRHELRMMAEIIESTLSELSGQPPARGRHTEL